MQGVTSVQYSEHIGFVRPRIQ